MIKFVNNQGGNADVEKIMEWINSYIMYNVEDGISSSMDNYNRHTAFQRLKDNLYSVNYLYAPQHALLNCGKGIKEKIKYYIKRVIRKAINWYIADINQGQIEFNAAITRYENENIQLIQSLIYENQKMSEQITHIQKGMVGGLDDQWYLAFEDKFRGESSIIQERIKKYVNYLKDKKSVFEIGCGRGELLSALRKAGINARGVDINREMVSLCKTKNLNVEVGDGVDALQKQKDQSLGAVVAIQVVEHLTLFDLKRLVDVAYKKLEDNGIIIIETVNPLALGIFCYGFYIDPTHVKPVHPNTMRFMLELAGFKVDPVQFDEYFPEEYRLPVSEDMEESTRVVVEKLNDQLYGAQDYYLIGRK